MYDQYVPPTDSSDGNEPSIGPHQHNANDSSFGTTAERKSLLIRFIYGTCAIIVLIALIGLVAFVFFPPPGTIDTQQDQPVTTPEPPKPDSLTKVRTDFGPWRIVRTGGESRGSLIFVHNNGSLEAGSGTVTPDGSWQPAIIPGMSSITPDLNSQVVSVRLSQTVTFIVAANQTFVLERAPEQLYAFTNEGNLISTTHKGK